MMLAKPKDEWLSIEDAYARRFEYDDQTRQRIVGMMRKERLHRLWMRTDSACGRRKIERAINKAPHTDTEAEG